VHRHAWTITAVALCTAAAHAGPDPTPAPPVLDLTVNALPGLLDSNTPESADSLSDAGDEMLYEASVFAWLLGFRADSSVDGFDVELDLDFGDVLDTLEFVGFLEVSVHNEDWMLRFAGMYSTLDLDGKGAEYAGEIEKDFGFDTRLENPILEHLFGDRGEDLGITVEIPDSLDVEIDVELDYSVASFVLGRKGISIPLDKAPPNRFTKQPASIEVIPYGGVRVTYIRVKTDVDVVASIGPVTVSDSFSVNDSEFWTDPIIGVDVAILNLDRWTMGVRADIGGFSIGNASKLAWSVGGRVRYALSPRFDVYAGYLFLDYDYADDNFAFDGYFHGPTLGGAITF
jgi:hypothetical protein